MLYYNHKPCNEKGIRMAHDEDNLPPAPKERKAPVIVARCGECMFFKDASAFREPCSKLGVGSLGRICHKFLPNVYRVLNTKLVASIMSMNPDQLRMICGLAHQELQTRKSTKEKWGAVGYFRLGGGDFLSNYRKGLVLAATEEHYYIMAEDGSSKIRATILHSNFFDENRWKRKEAVLRKKGLLVDPDYKNLFHVTKPKITAKYEPPSIDSAPVESEGNKSGIVSVRGRRK